MRKKYLSALLFGALLVASAGTFTSCKDYDDEINNLQEQIDGKASVEELQKQISTLQSDIAAAKAEAEAAKALAEEAKAKAEEALNNAGQGEEGLSKEEIQAMIDKANADIQKEIEKLAKTEEVDAKLAALKEELSASFLTEEDLEQIKTDISTLSKEIESIVGKVLNSLVYQPSLYVNGIEATEYPWMQYDQLKSTTATSTVYTDNEGVSCTVTSPESEWNFINNVTKEFDPEIYVDYHVNPSKAEIAKENLSLISSDAEVVNTRASQALPKIGEGDIKYENGILSVPVVAKGSLIKGNHTAGETSDLTKASIFALQANVKTSAGEDRVVTSDYASLYSSVITPQAIAYSVEDYNGFDINAVSCPATHDELYPTVGDALANEPTLRVAYDDTKGIDLKTLVEIHYNHTSLTSSNGTHKVWKAGDEKQYGLKYEFALIQYNAGTNATSDSKYCELKDGVLVPRIVDADGNTTSQQGLSSVGRHPLVRVTVVDGEGKIVLHSYIKVEIVRDVEVITTDVFDKGNIEFGCDDCIKKLEWSEVSALLIEKAGMSKEEFEQLYMVDANSGVVKQFKEVSPNKYQECTSASDIYGTVVEIPDANPGTTNPVLKWTIPMADQQRIYELAGNTKTIYVRYILRTSNPSGTELLGAIYMPIKVTTIKPEGKVVTKIDEYWYNNSKNTRLNVNYPADGGNTLNFTVDLNQVWVGNLPKFGPTSGFASYTDAILQNQNGANGGYKYYFADTKDYEVTDLDGNVYEIFAGQRGIEVTKAQGLNGNMYDVNKDNEKNYALSTASGVYMNTSLYARSTSGVVTEIAIINQSTGEITYLNNTVSKKLLNAYPHNAAELYAQIGICAYSPCDIALALEGSNYPAYFLRPISMNDNGTGEFIDAQANGSTINIAEVFNFVDWRDQEFRNGTDYKNVWLYAYYNVKQVDVKISDITTTLNGGTLGTTKLSDVTNKIKISQLDAAGNVSTTPVTMNLSAFNRESAGTSATWNAIVAAMGKIKYENNGNNVQDFKLQIPIEFTYDWGTIKSSVTVNVKSTMGN